MDPEQYRHLAEKWGQLAATVPDPGMSEIYRGLATSYTALADTTAHANPMRSWLAFDVWSNRLSRSPAPARHVTNAYRQPASLDRPATAPDQEAKA
jgi:hypothetical protein